MNEPKQIKFPKGNGFVVSKKWVEQNCLEKQKVKEAIDVALRNQAEQIFKDLEMAGCVPRPHGITTHFIVDVDAYIKAKEKWGIKMNEPK